MLTTTNDAGGTVEAHEPWTDGDWDAVAARECGCAACLADLARREPADDDADALCLACGGLGEDPRTGCHCRTCGGSGCERFNDDERDAA